MVAGLALTGISITAWNAAAVANAFADGGPKATTVTSPALAGDAQRRAGTDTAASRSHNRTIPPAGTPQSTGTAPENPTRTAAPPNPAAPALSKPTPAAGLSQSQMDNAIAIVEAGKQMNLPRRAFVVAIATALQESNLRILANPAVPGSTKHPNEGVGYDHDSIGLFQQRPNWGNVDQLMDPLESARRFYAKLVTIPSWERLAITVAAQAVQSSAFPGRTPSTSPAPNRSWPRFPCDRVRYRRPASSSRGHAIRRGRGFSISQVSTAGPFGRHPAGGSDPGTLAQAVSSSSLSPGSRDNDSVRHTFIVASAR